MSEQDYVCIYVYTCISIVLHTAVGKLSCEEVEKRFADVINTLDNSAVGKGLSCCGLLHKDTYESLRQISTIYQMSCLSINIILCMDEANFENLCGYIECREQVKDLRELYFGK